MLEPDTVTASVYTGPLSLDLEGVRGGAEFDLCNDPYWQTSILITMCTDVQIEY